MSVKKIGLGVVVLIAFSSIGALYYYNGAGFQARTDTFVFERDVRQDHGRPLTDLSKIVAVGGTKKGMRLSDVFSDLQVARYGVVTGEKEIGVGLKVTGIIRSGDQAIAEPILFEGIPRWETFEEGGDNDARNVLVLEQKDAFAKSFVRQFAGAIKLDFAFGFILDTTDGVNADLARRAREVVDESQAVEFANQGHSVVVNYYHIYESSYQGGRRRVNLSGANSMADTTNWFVTPQAEAQNSSVLRGLQSIFREVEGYADKRPQIHVFTDMLENIPELSVYARPALLDNEAGWSQLDQIADLSQLHLAGVEIHLYPLPPKAEWQVRLMEKGLRYLADRLTKAGARVKIEPL